MMVGSNLKDTQLQQIVDKTILFADKDEDGKISFEEFCSVSFFSICLLNSSERSISFENFDLGNKLKNFLFTRIGV